MFLKLTWAVKFTSKQHDMCLCGRKLLFQIICNIKSRPSHIPIEFHNHSGYAHLGL